MKEAQEVRGKEGVSLRLKKMKQEAFCDVGGFIEFEGDKLVSTGYTGDEEEEDLLTIADGNGEI